MLKGIKMVWTTALSIKNQALSFYIADGRCEGNLYRDVKDSK
jgi:hypothetical protein